jgi:hypothetical protein
MMIGVNTGPVPRMPIEGVPCVSENNMDAWMKYLYMQQPMPTSATGVTISLDTLDPNGNFVHIGNPTTDLSGKYSYVFTPEVSGKYIIIASFAGTQSYGLSSAETAINIGEPSATTSPQEPAPQSIADMYFIPSIAGIIATIIIGFVVLGVLMLRKRP